MATPLAGTESAAGAIERVRYSHDAMIDLILVNPGIHQNEIARHFGYTPAWVSRIMCSDAFQARLAERKSELVDPTIVASTQERLEAVARKSLDLLLEKLEVPGASTDLVVKAVEVSTKALGYGARDRGVQVSVTQNSYVAMIPPKAATAAEWQQEHDPRKGLVEQHDGASIPHTPAPVLEQKPVEREFVAAVGTGELVEVK